MLIKKKKKTTTSNSKRFKIRNKHDSSATKKQKKTSQRRVNKQKPESERKLIWNVDFLDIFPTYCVAMYRKFDSFNSPLYLEFFLWSFYSRFLYFIGFNSISDHPYVCGSQRNRKIRFFSYSLSILVFIRLPDKNGINKCLTFCSC